MKGIKDRVAVITGAADGIGRGIAQRLAEDGVKLVLTDIDAPTGEATAAEIRDQTGADIEFRQVDVCDRGQVEGMIATAVERFGTVDILINNAWGGTRQGRIEGKTDEEIQRGLDMTVFAAKWAMQAAFPVMKAKGWGRIVSMCSLNGVNAHMYSADYNVGKEALRAFTRTAAREWAGYGITANIVCPAAVSAAYKRLYKTQSAMLDALAAQNPMGRMGDPYEDIAPVIAFLVSDEARYMTGNTLYVDGGGHINGVAWAPKLADEG
jgi:NAD(P)-dependent dehydrogenase (short-subunit alcohol dehydrogenase family)